MLRVYFAICLILEMLLTTEVDAVCPAPAVDIPGTSCSGDSTCAVFGATASCDVAPTPGVCCAIPTTTTSTTSTSTTSSAGGNGTATTTRCPSGEAEQPGVATCLNVTCGAGYQCLYATIPNTYVCCSLTQTVPGYTPSLTTTRCNNGYVEQPFIVNCLSPIVCAKNYKCQYSTSANTYCCCSLLVQITGYVATPASQTGTNLCTNGGTQQLSPTNCLSPNRCTGSASCVYSTKASTYICCSTTGK